jgi:hypothetical protein
MIQKTPQPRFQAFHMSYAFSSNVYYAYNWEGNEMRMQIVTKEKAALVFVKPIYP